MATALKTITPTSAILGNKLKHHPLQWLSDKLQLSKKTKHQSNNNNHHMKILGHRGALYDRVENTLDSFQHCIDVGCHGVELDVFVLKDGSLVVFHGTGTDQTPGLLDGYCHAPTTTTCTTILDLDYAQTQQLQFVHQSQHVPGLNQSTAPSARIPTLRQVLELFQQQPTARHMTITIELKGQGTVEPSIRLVEEMGMQDQVLFSSFRHERVQRVKQLRPQFKTAATFAGTVPDNVVDMAKDLQADELHLRYDTCTVERVRAAQAAGLTVMAWCRGPKAMEHDIQGKHNEVMVLDLVRQTGANAICCNQPQLGVEYMQELQQQQQQQQQQGGLFQRKDTASTCVIDSDTEEESDDDDNVQVDMEN